VDEQGDRSRGAPLGLDDLEVLAGQRQRLVRGGAAQYRVADRADRVEWLLVAETPFATRAGDLAGRSGIADVVRTPTACLEDVEHTTKRGLAEAAQRARSQGEPVAAAAQVALLAQFTLDAAELGEVFDGASAQRL